MKLANVAKKNGIQVVGLESLDGQLKALSSGQPDNQLEMLRAGLAYVERSDDLVETLIQLYLKREIGATWPFQIALAEKAGVSADAYEGFRTRIIVERNRKMRDAAIPLLEKGGAFIAVGALHLPYDDGLVALLRKSGFEVTAVE